MTEMSSTSRRASQTRSSPASRGEDVSAAVMRVNHSDVAGDVHKADEATSTQIVLQADVASIPAKPSDGVKAVRFRYRGQTTSVS